MTYNAATVSHCTGWFVSDIGHVATAGHCLEPSRGVVLKLYRDVIEDNDIKITGVELKDLDWKFDLEDPTTYVGQPSVIKGVLDDPTIAQVVAQQPFQNGDNALLRVANLSETPALAIAKKQPEVGDKVIAIGFAGSVDDVTDTDRQPPSQKSGSVSSLSTSTRGAPVTEVDAAVTGGMSGGPTINENGEVIGINSFGITGESQPFNFVTDTDSMMAFFKQNGVPINTDLASSNKVKPEAGAPDAPTAVAERGSDDEGGNTLVVVLWVIVALLAAGFGWMFLKMRQQQKAVNQPPPT